MQQAIQAASSGDTVLVSPGTYVENLDFLGKAITVMSTSGPQVTILEAQSHGDHGSVVTFDSDEGADSKLEGFTLQGGTGTNVNGYYYGGGVFCDHASPTIKGNVITHNIVNDNGGGIYCDNWASPLIQENVISENICSFGGGGGIYSDGHSKPEIVGNLISANQAADAWFGRGGGINGDGLMRDNIIMWNIAYYEGGGIYSKGSITDNIIMENISYYGGGISCWSGAYVAGNHIQDNLSQYRG
ncbi:MAG: DUF1565 domain-containing protein [Planctomycetes bacterium]|nr:DUF1565 domain-containing protein [Planctomycetota bacterium]